MGIFLPLLMPIMFPFADMVINFFKKGREKRNYSKMLQEEEEKSKAKEQG